MPVVHLEFVPSHLTEFSKKRFWMRHYFSTEKKRRWDWLGRSNRQPFWLRIEMGYSQETFHLWRLDEESDRWGSGSQSFFAIPPKVGFGGSSSPLNDEDLYLAEIIFNGGYTFSFWLKLNLGEKWNLIRFRICPAAKHDFKNIRAFMLIEVLIALTLFALSAVYLVEGAFVATQRCDWWRIRGSPTAFPMGQEWDLSNRRFWKLGMGDLPTHRNIETNGKWQVWRWLKSLISTGWFVLSHNGSDELRMDPETRNYVMLLLRPNWGRQRDFISDGQRLVVDKELIRGWTKIVRFC